MSQLADRSGVTLRIYHRLVESMEQRKIIQNATRRNKLKSGGNDVNDTIEAEGNLQDVIELLANLRKNKEPLLHCSVFIELKARSMDALKELQSDIAMELTRSKISVDRLMPHMPTCEEPAVSQHSKEMYPEADPNTAFTGPDQATSSICLRLP